MAYNPRDRVSDDVASVVDSARLVGMSFKELLNVVKECWVESLDRESKEISEYKVEL